MHPSLMIMFADAQRAIREHGDRPSAPNTGRIRRRILGDERR